MDYKVTLDKTDLEIIKAALESYYYICRDDGSMRYICDDITALEIKMNEQINK